MNNITWYRIPSELYIFDWVNKKAILIEAFSNTVLKEFPATEAEVRLRNSVLGISELSEKVALKCFVYGWHRFQELMKDELEKENKHDS